MEYVRFGFSLLFILIGLFITITGVLGFYKYKYILNRMHSSALIDTLGIFFIILGLIIARGFTNEAGEFDVTSIKLIMIVFFLWLTSPVSSHMIARIVYLTDSTVNKEAKECEIDIQEEEEIK